MSGPLNPKEVAQAAIKARILTKAHQHWPNEEFDYAPKVKLPEEAGIAAVRPPPPKPRHTYKKTTPKKSRYIITPAQLLEMGFTRQELQHIKNEVMSQCPSPPLKTGSPGSPKDRPPRRP